MIKYFIKYYFRNLFRRKLFSFIKISGLSFGIAFIVLIGQYVYYEFNNNSEIKDVAFIYRLVDANEKNYNVDYRIKNKILENIPGVNNACLLNNFEVDVEAENKFFRFKNMLMVDSNFFNIFGVSFIHGNSDHALSSISNVVITESAAKRIFGRIDVVGKTLTINHQNKMLVTGVTYDLPKNISFGGELFVSFENSPKQQLFWRMDCINNNGSNDKCKYLFSAFVKLNKNIPVEDVEKNIASLSKEDEFLYPSEVILTPLGANYFNTQYDDAELQHGNIGLIQLLIIIGIIILFLAVINFINLSTASFRYRFKEFGVKKCLGADRNILIKQLIAESFFTTIISALLGIFLAEILLPDFNKFINKPLELRVFRDFHFFIFFITFIITLSFIIGILPSLALSKISPLYLFNKLKSSEINSAKNYRNILTVFQFSIAIILIAALFVIRLQIDFVKHKDPGFNIERLLYLKIHYTLGDRLQVLTDKLSQYHGIKSLTKTFGIPGEILLTTDGYRTITADTLTVETFGFKVLKGRDFLSSDNYHKVLINKTALNQIKDKNWKNHKINGCEIAGIISDFQFSSLHNKIEALVLWYNSGVTPSAVTIRILGSVYDAIKYINKTWKETFPDYPVEINFYDENFASMYAKEENLAALVSIFSILAVVISCMGIFGLSVFQSEQRIKEIGIRKVLGASVSSIFLMLSKEFIKWIAIANIIAWPIAYYFMNQWLQDFAYRIDINLWVFALSGLAALLIALATVSFQAIKAATANPVESLKYE